jgi:hypothetical protein
LRERVGPELYTRLTDIAMPITSLGGAIAIDMGELLG